MRYTSRLGLAIGFLGAVTLAGVAFAQGGTEDAAAPGVGPKGPPGIAGPMHDRGFGWNLVTGTGTFQTEDGFVTRRLDTGEITTVVGDTITIERADGESVTVTVDDDTVIRRDREEATAAELAPGDRAHIMQVDEGDGFTVAAVMALSPEAQERMEEHRAEWGDRFEQRREHMQERRQRFRQRFGERFGTSDEGAEETSA